MVRAGVKHSGMLRPGHCCHSMEGKSIIHFDSFFIGGGLKDEGPLPDRRTVWGENLIMVKFHCKKNNTFFVE